MNLAEPDAVLFTMDILKSSTKKTFHHHTVFNNDQQLFKITTQMIWWQPDVWKNVHPVLFGMQMLI